MKQSPGLGLLILGAVVLIEGEPPMFGWGRGVVGVQGSPSAQQPLQFGVCEDCLWVTVRLW